MKISTNYLVLTKQQIDASVERQKRPKVECKKGVSDKKQHEADDYDPVIKKSSFYELGSLASRGIKKEIDYKKSEF